MQNSANPQNVGPPLAGTDSLETARLGRARANVEQVRRQLQRMAQLHAALASQPLPRSVGIVGGGVMGCEIAAAHLAKGIEVVLVDCDAAVRRGVGDRVAAELHCYGFAGKAAAMVQGLRVGAEAQVAAACDLVIESIAEIEAAKQALYAQIESHLKSGALLVSNTSTIPIARLGSRLADPSRFCGLHFCHPVAARPLVEVIGGPTTSGACLARAVAHAAALGKLPLVVTDGPGFIVNRLLVAYLGEALDLLLEGVSPAEIERTMLEFGMACGPLHLLDEIGLDTALRAALVLSAAFGDRVVRSPVLVALVKAGRLGHKTGAGVFCEQTQVSDPALAKIVADWARPPRQHTADSILTRLLVPMVLEASQMLEEGVVAAAAEIDAALLFGLGFPPDRGGLLWWADTLGKAHLMGAADSFRELSSRGWATARVESLIRAGGSFYSPWGDGRKRSPTLSG